MTNWQPFQTAPRDGTIFLSLAANGARVGWMYPYMMRSRGLNWEYLDGQGWKYWCFPLPDLWVAVDVPKYPPRAIAMAPMLDPLEQAIEVLREVVDYYDSPDGKVLTGPSYAFSAAEFLAKHGAAR